MCLIFVYLVSNRVIQQRFCPLVCSGFGVSGPGTLVLSESDHRAPVPTEYKYNNACNITFVSEEEVKSLKHHYL